MAPKAKKGSLTNKTTAPTAGGQQFSDRTAKPKWPALAPLIPPTDLELVSLQKDQILVVPKLWTAALCKAYITFLATLPLSTTPGKPKKGEAVRVNDRFQIDDAAFARQLWTQTALGDLVQRSIIDGGEPLDGDARRTLWGGEVLGLNSNIRVYRYSKGQFFDQHYDESNNVFFPSASSADAVPAKTTWTLLLYLSSPATGCVGGETVFYPDAPSRRERPPPPIVARPDVGMALLHRHGDACMLHEGREVTDGEKWIIRSDLCVRR